MGYDELLDQLDPLLASWYKQRFSALSPPQALAVPCIIRGQNTLVSSPTGTGKTLTGFLAVLDHLFKLARAGELEDRVYCVYVSPLKALANDIDRNLREPLLEIARMVKDRKEKLPNIRVGLRSGDTPQSKRAAMTRKPPHILITTPESLSLVLAAPRFSQHLKGVTHLILDELHDLATSKRGTLLSLSIEQLCYWLDTPPVRIGLSATLAPLETLAHFLAGYAHGRARPCTIVEAAQWKQLDLKVLCPVADGTRTPASLAFEKQMELLVKLISEHSTSLIFTNTRAGTERVLLKLKELGVEAVAAHHGSMAKEVRLRVERQLKDQKLKAVVSSTSLELGLDIGDLDLVIQLGSPRSIAKGLQRVGRAGHALQAVAKGRFVAYEPDELLECSALVQEAIKGALDKVEPPEQALDVLAQALVGLSLHGEWKVKELWELARGAWPYRELKLETLEEIIEYLGTMELSGQGVYPKVGHDPETGVIYPRRSSRLLYYLNVGTIPSQANYSVVLEATGQPLGSLEESFVERLRTGDIFVLGGRLFAFQGLRGSTALVRDGQSHRPTIPSWGGEVAPRSRELSAAVSAHREKLGRELEEVRKVENSEGQDDLGARFVSLQEVWRERYHLDPGAANTIFNHLNDQLSLTGMIPTQDRLLVEGYLDPQGEPEALINSPFGRRVNEAWGRALAQKLSRIHDAEVILTVAEEGFILKLPSKMELSSLCGLVDPKELEVLLLITLQDSEPLKLRFRNTASRALAVLRNYRVHEVSLRRQRQRTQDLLAQLSGTEHFLMREALKEVEYELWDIPTARRLLQGVKEGTVRVEVRDYDTQVSPMGLPLLLAGLSGSTTLEQRWNLQRELHTEILAHIIPAGEIGKARFEPEFVTAFFAQRRKATPAPESILELLHWQGALDLISHDEGSMLGLLSTTKTTEIAGGTDENDWLEVVKELIDNGAVTSVWNGESRPQWALPEQAGNYQAIYGRRGPLSKILEAAWKRLAKGERPKADHLVRGLRRAFRAGHDSLGRLIIMEPPEPAIYEEALEWMVALKLRNQGPLSADELAMLLQMEVAEISQVLDHLVVQGQVTVGYFVPDSPPVQYLWTHDCVHLELMLEGEKEVIDHDTWMSFNWERSLRSHDDWQKALKHMGGAVNPITVWQRCPDLKVEEWSQAMNAGELLQGRFKGGLIHNLPAELVPLFVSCFRIDMPGGGLDKDILNLLRNSDQGLTKRELTTSLTPRSSRDTVSEALRRLEGNLRVHRRPLVGSGTSRPLQNYLALPEMPLVDRPHERLVELMLEGHGPASRYQLWQLTGLDGEPLAMTLGSMEAAGKIVRITCAGIQPEYLYVLDKDRISLKAHRTEPPPPTLLHRGDPLVLATRREIQARYGEGWTMALMEGGKPAGIVELDPRPGVVEVTNVKLQREGLWSSLLKELRRVTGFYRQTAGEVLLWRKGAGGSLGQMGDDIMETFTKAGYLSRWDLRAQGHLLEDNYPFYKLMAFMLSCQHIHPRYRFGSGPGAIRSLMEVRDIAELSVRVNGPFNTPDDYAPELNMVYGPGAFGPQSYMTRDRARLLQKAKAAPLSLAMKEVLSLLSQGPALTRDMLVKRTHLERPLFSRALRGLTGALLIVKDPWGAYMRLEAQNDMNTGLAKETLLLNTLKEVGVATYEGLIKLLSGYFDGSTLLGALNSLEQRQLLCKGFLDQEEVTLYYILTEQVSRLSKISGFKGAFVLAPTDRMAQILAPRVSQEFGLTGAHIVFEGPKMEAAFRLRRSGRRVRVIEYEGHKAKQYVVDEWARQFHLDLSWDLETSAKGLS